MYVLRRDSPLRRLVCADGYTSASFSGRMPMAELADAVVQCGRSTLEWTIQMIEQGLDPRDLPRHVKGTYEGWNGAKVVYGDTDSVFVHLPGRTKEEAFRIGREIAQFISEQSPDNVVLKMEKVYLPCVLVTKKRYVGQAYETPEQTTPHFDAKGIECIRRDQCLATAKIQEKVLRLLFKYHGNLSVIQRYLQETWYKIELGGNQLSIRDFIFHKAVKLGHYANASSYPPGATVALKHMLWDPHAYPVYKWRVPYVVVYGDNQKSLLKDLVVSPEEVLRRTSTNVYTLNARYYISKCINPALQRILSICGVDVALWYRHMPQHAVTKQRKVLYKGADEIVTAAERMGTKQTLVQTSILQFSNKSICEICGQHATQLLCSSCRQRWAETTMVMQYRINGLKRMDERLAQVCRSCAYNQSHQQTDLFAKGEMLGAHCCSSLDCPVFHQRYAAMIRLEDLLLAAEEMSITHA